MIKNRSQTVNIGSRTNRFPRGTNDFGFRTNRFNNTNDFGSRSNRFGTNEFGQITNRFSFTNELALSNTIELSNDLGFVPTDIGGFIPGAGGAVAVGGGGVNPAPVAPPNQSGEPTPPATGVPTPGNRVYANTATNRAGVALQDRSVTEQDRILLQQLRQLVIPRLEGMGGWGPAVHFWVHDGIVTTVGAVPSRETKSEALAMIQQIPGVAGVQDRLFVGNVDPNATDVDQELQYRIRETVVPQISRKSAATPVDFAVRDGVVTVVGRVPSPEDASRITKLVQQVPGVGQVKNQLLVSNTENSSNVLGSPTPTGTDVQTNTNLTPTGPSKNDQLPNPGDQNPPPPQ